MLNEQTRAERHGWDDEPRPYDYQQAQYLWCMGYRRAWRCTQKSRQRTLTRYGLLLGRRNAHKNSEKYTTLREFRAFIEIEATYIAALPVQDIDPRVTDLEERAWLRYESPHR